MSGNGHRWSTPLKMDELWLNSDREILGRAEKTAGKVGVVLTIDLPHGESIAVEVDKLNAETGTAFCQMARDYFDEYKASKEAASSRAQRDRQQSAALVGSEPDRGGESETGIFSVQETVEALETRVQGAATLEEEVIHRIDAAYDKRAKLRAASEQLNKDLTAVESEITQLEQMKEIFSASKVLEQASASVPKVTPEAEKGVDSESHRSPIVSAGGEGIERDSSGD